MMNSTPSTFQNYLSVRNGYDIVFVFVLSVGISLFFVSLFCSAFYTNNEILKGYWILSLGWLGLFFFQLAWLANPLNLIAILLIKQNPFVSFLLSGLALLLATQSFLLFELPTGIQQEKIFIKELGGGFYLWYLANCLFLLAIFAKFLGNLKNSRNSV